VVRELIGRGGMARVYRADHLLLNKPVALKVMDHALLLSTEARQRFLQEGRAASAIKHPNVVDITDVGLHDGVPYLVMELLTGEDLEGHLRRHTVLDDGATIRLALPIIAALHVAHSAGIVHRDIKPSNIFMSVGPDEQLVPKVLDFGISKVSFDNPAYELATTPQHQLIGTPRYMPPEALHGARELGPLSDQYSLGVVLYQCVTGCTPFNGDTLVSLFNSLSRGAFEPPRTLQPSVSSGLDRIITRSLSSEPSDRFPNIREMGRALLDLAAERTQMVWGRSFRVPSTPQPIALVTNDGEGSQLTPGAPLPTTRRLSRWSLAGKGRPWARVGTGLALMLVGASAPALWSASSAYLALGSESSGPASVRQLPKDLAPAVQSTPPPSEQRSDTTIVMGLAPRPPDATPDPRPSEGARPSSREPRVQARRTASGPGYRVAARNAEKGKSNRRSAQSDDPAPPAPRPVTPASEPRPKREGANRSPLLD
jgi:eukaryotic-like serine/threonine-protein kinase